MSNATNAQNAPLSKSVHFPAIFVAVALLVLISSATAMKAASTSFIDSAAETFGFSRTLDSTGAFLKPAKSLARNGANGSRGVFSGAPNDHTVLILDTTVLGGASSQEANEAAAKGMTVEVVNAATWAAKTAAEFATYRAIILGDPNCSTTPSTVAAPTANGSVWGPIVNGNVIINGTDAVDHSSYAPGAVILTKNSVDFAIEKVGKTGAYISLSCYFYNSAPGTPVPLLNNAFGSGFTVRSTGTDNIHLVATSSALAGLTDANLSNWGQSTHEAFDSFPVDFAPLAVAVGQGTYVSPDGTVGNPYIIARGVTVLSNISLTDDGHNTHFLGQSHTYTATVTTDTPSPGTPVVGTTVTFGIISGPNTGTTGTGVTNASGQTTFTYTSALTGTDFTRAQFVDSSSRTQSSGNVPVTWLVNPATAPVVTAAANQTANEGASTLFNLGSFADPDGGPWTVDVDWGDLSAHTNFAAASAGAITAQSHTYVQNAVRTVTVKVTDSGGLFNTNTFTVTVSNVDPSSLTLSLSATTINENGSTSLSGSFSDPGTQDTHTVTITWGDGTTTTLNLTAGVLTIPSTPHTYLDDDPTGTSSDVYTIGVTVADNDGGSTSGSTSVTVNNVAPTLTTSAVTPVTILENGTTTLNGTFSDPGTLDVHTLTVGWADGSTSVVTLPVGQRTFSVSHQYLDDGASPGNGTASDSYVLTISVADDDGGNSSTGGSGSGSGAVIIDGGDRDDHGSFSGGVNQGGWKYIEQMVGYTYGARKNGKTGILVVGASSTALAAINSSISVLGLPAATVVTGAGLNTVNFNNYGLMYIPSNDSNTGGGINSADRTTLTTRKTDIQNFINNGGSLVNLTDASSPTPYTWLQLPNTFTIGNPTSDNQYQTPALTNSGLVISNADLIAGTPLHNIFTGPPGFNGLVPFVYNVGANGVNENGGGDDQVVTLGLAAGSVGVGLNVIVQNVAPSALSISLSAATINEGGSTSISGSFTDPGTLDAHTVSINWGDGSTNTVINRTAGVLTIPSTSHTYVDDNPVGTSSDNYAISVTVADDDTGSTSGSTSVTVNNVAPTATFTNSGPYVFGQPGSVSFSNQADPSAADLAGLRYSYDFDNNGTWEVGNGTYAGSSGTTATAVVPASFLVGVGPHVVKGRVMDDDLGFTDYTTTITVNKANTATILTSSVNPSVWGQSVTFTATISVTAPGAGTPTGNVTFKDGATTICAAVVVTANVATCTTSTLTVGSHQLTATYNGDGSFNASTGNLTQIVGKSDTTTTLTSSLNPSSYGQPVTMTAMVTPAAPGAGTVTGTVSFTYDGNLICPNTPIVSGQAQCVMSSMTAGTHAIGASYSGDGNFRGSSGVLSPPQVVNKAATTTTITNPAALAGQTNVGTSYPVNWTVAVTAPGAGTPTGTVTVTDGTGATCTAAVAAGTCSLPSQTVGAKSITATYSGDANFLTSASAPAITTHTVVITISGTIRKFVQGGPNTPLSGISVALSGTNTPGSTITDVNGNYSFTGVFTGTYTITPSSASFVFDPLTRTYSGLLANLTGADFLAYVSPGPIQRQLRVVNQYITAGQAATMSLVLSSQDNEVSNAFSLNFDTNIITGVPTVVCGSAAPGCTVVTDNSVAGKIGITITPTTGYTTGDREIARVTFQTVSTNAPNTPVTFGGTPTASLTKDASGNPLPVTYVNGFIVFQQNLESDISTRNSGNGDVDTTDITLVRQMVIGSLTPDPNFNEFQRADSAPAGSKGDGQLDSTDVIQARRYASRIDTPTAAGGPFVARPVGASPRPEVTTAVSRVMRAGSVNTSPGNRITLPIELDTKGDEVAASFTLSFDPAKLQNPTITMGDGAEAGTTLTTNIDQAADGRITVLVDGNSLAKQLINITFDVAQTAGSGETRVSFTNDPTPSVISNVSGDKLTTDFENGTVTITGPNTSGFEVSGRILTPDGHGLRNARVTIIDQNGAARTVATGAFGHYTFDGVPQGGTYTIGVISRQFRFKSRSVEVTNNLTDIDLVGQE